MLTDSPPLKWKKELVPILFGMRELKTLEDGVRRFKRNDVDGLCAAISASIENDPREAMFIVRLIPQQRIGGLPNMRLKCEADLPGLRHWIAGAPTEYVEVWFARASVGADQMSVAGRVAWSGHLRGQVVEQVWRDSPRVIDRFDPESRTPFLRASRPNWGWRWEECFLHPAGEQKETLLQEFRAAMREFERLQEPIERFCAFVEALGITSYNVEYKYEGRLLVIDWDTSDDLRVLNAIWNGR